VKKTYATVVEFQVSVGTEHAMDIPDEVFEDRQAFTAFITRMGGDPRRDGESLIAYLRGWLERHEAESGESLEKKEAAKRLISELTEGLEGLYAQDVAVARLEDELDILREQQTVQIANLRRGYRKMVFWRGRHDADVIAAQDWVRQEFPTEVAAHILDTDGLFDDDVPQE
jgi:hypothetical protein